MPRPGVRTRASLEPGAHTGHEPSLSLLPAWLSEHFVHTTSLAAAAFSDCQGACCLPETQNHVRASSAPTRLLRRTTKQVQEGWWLQPERGETHRFPSVVPPPGPITLSLLHRQGTPAEEEAGKGGCLMLEEKGRKRGISAQGRGLGMEEVQARRVKFVSYGVGWF